MSNVGFPQSKGCFHNKLKRKSYWTSSHGKYASPTIALSICFKNALSVTINGSFIYSSTAHLGHLGPLISVVPKTPHLNNQIVTSNLISKSTVHLNVGKGVLKGHGLNQFSRETEKWHRWNTGIINMQMRGYLVKTFYEAENLYLSKECQRNIFFPQDHTIF